MITARIYTLKLTYAVKHSTHKHKKKHKQIMISTSHQLYAVYALAPNASFLLINSNFIETFHRHLFFPKKNEAFFVIT